MGKEYQASLVAFDGLEERILLQPLVVLTNRVAYSRRLSRAVRLIMARYQEDLKLELASHDCGVEKNHLNKLLRDATGFTFHRLLVRYRLLQAALLIGASNLNLLDVALRSGFGSLSSLERNFEKVLHQTPMAYRQNCRHLDSVSRTPLVGLFS